MRCRRRRHHHCGQMQRENKKKMGFATAHRTHGSQFNYNYLLIKVPESHMRAWDIWHARAFHSTHAYAALPLWTVAVMRVRMNISLCTHRTHHLIWWMGKYSVRIPHTECGRARSERQNGRKIAKKEKWMKIACDSGFIAIFIRLY